MSLPEKPLPYGSKKLAYRTSFKSSDLRRLKASQAYRSLHKSYGAVLPEQMGTAEHRPQRGLLYDAPLGLKF